MVSKDNFKAFKIEQKYLKDFSKIDFKKFNLKKTSKENIFLYQSLGYKILRWDIKPKVFIDINKNEDEINLSIKEIKGIEVILNKIQISIKVLIKKKLNYLEINRYFNIKISEKPIFLLFVSNYIYEKIIDKVIFKICERFDRKLISKISKYR